MDFRTDVLRQWDLLTEETPRYAGALVCATASAASAAPSWQPAPLRPRSARLPYVATGASDPFPNSGGPDSVHWLAYSKGEWSSPAAFAVRSTAFQPSCAFETRRR